MTETMTKTIGLSGFKADGKYDLGGSLVISVPYGNDVRLKLYGPRGGNRDFAIMKPTEALEVALAIIEGVRLIKESA